MSILRYHVRSSLLAVIVISLLGGCAISSVFVSYPAQLRTIKQQIDNNQFGPAQITLSENTDGADKILYLMEKGRTGQIGKDTRSSIADFKLAMEEMEANDDEAKFTASGAGAQTAALLTNDNAIPYKGESYERIFLHHFQAMNYLFDKNIDAAVVEVRRANENQMLALQEHETEIAELEEENSEAQGFLGKFDSLNISAERVKNSFQNAYTFYTSAVIYEILGQANDAYIDYKKAIEIFPENSYLQQDVLRLASQLSMKEDLERYTAQFENKPQTVNNGDGELIVFFEHGFAPPKLEIKVDLSTVSGIHSVAFPTYAPLWNNTLPLKITNAAGNKFIGDTQPIVFVQALASKALQEKLPSMITRQILRVVAKNATQHEASKRSEGLGLVMAIFNVVSENADQRSWLTLPNDAQIFRGSLGKGDHTLLLNNGMATGSIKVTLTPGKKTIVRVISTGNSVHAESITM